MIVASPAICMLLVVVSEFLLEEIDLGGREGGSRERGDKTSNCSRPEYWLPYLVTKGKEVAKYKTMRGKMGGGSGGRSTYCLA